MNKKQISEVVKAVIKHQTNPLVHPLTCGNDSTHEILQPIVSDGEVHLWCVECDYVQKHIPSFLTAQKPQVTQKEIHDAYREVRNALNDWAGGISDKDKSYVALSTLYKTALTYVFGQEEK